MPLIYKEAVKRRMAIEYDALLPQLEIHGFAKCVSRKTCMDELPREERIKTLRDSLAKQYDDFDNATDRLDLLEALADIRNVAGLLFLALK